MIRKKWKYLRDQFAVEFSKQPVSRSGDEGGVIYKCKWAHFNSLLFLKDIVKPRRSTGNLSNVEEPTNQGSNSEPNEEVFIEDIEVAEITGETVQDVPIDTLVETSIHTPAISGCKRKRRDSYNEEILKIEKQKLEYFQKK